MIVLPVSLCPVCGRQLGLIRRGRVRTHIAPTVSAAGIPQQRAGGRCPGSRTAPSTTTGA